jgi:uncharacterized alpha-E superfamily protein
MLSRVADSLFWMSRYMERAEDIARIMTVNFNALLDMPAHDAAQSWRSILKITGDEQRFSERYEDHTAENVMAYLLWHDDNPNAVLTCITLARENARAVRDQISSEMWEQINGLYYALRAVRADTVLRGPTPFFAQIRDGSHAFQGVTHATMTHGDGYNFIQLGKYLERAEKTARILNIKYADLGAHAEGSPTQTIELSAMLRSCSAMEAYRKYAQTLHPARVAEFLLLNVDFPRTVAFCMQGCEDALRAIAGDATQRGNAQTEHPAIRAAGRINAQLTYLDLTQVLGDSLRTYIEQLLVLMNTLGHEITQTFFSAQIILPGWRSYTQQVQQQQQQ